VAEEFLNLKQMGCKGMTQGVRSGWLCQPGLVNGLFYNLLQNGFMHVVSALLSGYSIGEMASRWKNPLPAPFSPSVRILTFEGVRQCDSAQAALKIALVSSLYQIKVLGEWFFHVGGKHRVPILPPYQLGRIARNELTVKVEVKRFELLERFQRLEGLARG
jgi:hypothetical protein